MTFQQNFNAQNLFPFLFKHTVYYKFKLVNEHILLKNTTTAAAKKKSINLCEGVSLSLQQPTIKTRDIATHSNNSNK